ncbi:MAG: Rpn family recombination-promoting nuclease/putative transposase [Coriobacteriales bacterium]|nr:Rpn family recombination-promoting nuclease/putative transposase [Coriobacteriales bacterium]
MGALDAATKKYVDNPNRFADVFNYAIYDGEQVVDATSLRPLDTAVATSTKGKSRFVERHRDGLKLWKAMADGHAAYALLGIERQTDVNLAMPARCMLYDALAYSDQVNRLKHENRKQGNLDSRSFISGLRPNDRLLPVATLVVHFGSDEWDGATNLHAMLSKCDKRLLAFVADYRINLVSPASMDAEDFAKFKTDFGLVLGYIKYAHDKDNLQRFVLGNDRFHSVDTESAGLINLLTDSQLEIAPGEERVDMCKAIEDMRAEARDDGLRLGLERGLERGVLGTLRDLVRDGVLSLADAAGRAGLTPEDFQAKVSAL